MRPALRAARLLMSLGLGAALFILAPGSAGKLPDAGAADDLTQSEIAAAEAQAQRSYDLLPALPPLSGGRLKTIRLIAEEKSWLVAPRVTARAWTYNGTVPGPTIHVRQGDRLRVILTNHLPEATTIHWHGLEVPAAMDGVPGMNQAAVEPDHSFTYEFTVMRPGTYMYHTHFDDFNQLDRGLYGALVVEPAQAGGPHYDRDYLMLLSSWKIFSGSENYFSINGKSYPLTKPFMVKRGQRVRIREINISGTEFHTMHIHGHRFKLIAIDGQPIAPAMQQSMVTLNLGPGETRDIALSADAQPGTWMVHCHVADHMLNGGQGPGGLISAIQYAGAPPRLGALADADTMSMQSSASTGSSAGPPLNRTATWILGAIAGLTIFLGLPFAAIRNLAPRALVFLNSLAIGVLFFLLFDILRQAGEPIGVALHALQGGGPANQFIALFVTYVAGMAVGLIGLVYFSKTVIVRYRHAAYSGAVSPLALATTIALGIGAHNFSEGLAIGQSAATGAVQLAVLLIVGFGLHNMTEGFGIAAPLAGTSSATLGSLMRLGIIGGGPTLLGTIIGYRFVSPLLSVIFLTVAAGAIIYVIGELMGTSRRLGFKELATVGVFAGFVAGFATDLMLSFAGA